MDLGTRIRHLREKLGMNRKELAHGIVSYSHMSNIESGRFVPGDDVLRLLAKKLQVPEDYLLLHAEKDEELEKLLDEINEALEVHEDTEKAEQLLNQIEEQYGERINSTEQEVYYYLLKCYCLNLASQQNLANETYKNRCLPIFNISYSKYRSVCVIRAFYKISALYYYIQWDYERCYEYTQSLLEYSETNVQKADAYYYMGRVLTKIKKHRDAIMYIKKSIQLFEDNNNRIKAIKGYILLYAVLYEINYFQGAKKSMLKAISLSEQYNITRNIEYLYYNLGHMYKIEGNNEKCREYYLIALKIMKSKNKTTHINIVYRSLIPNFINTNEINLANKYIEEAKRYCVNEVDYKLLGFFIAKIHFIKGRFKAYEQQMKETVEYSCKNKITQHLTLYTKDLADYYYEKRQYQKASYYYLVNIESYDIRYNNILHHYDNFIGVDEYIIKLQEVSK